MHINVVYHVILYFIRMLVMSTAVCLGLNYTAIYLSIYLSIKILHVSLLTFLNVIILRICQIRDVHVGLTLITCMDTGTNIQNCKNLYTIIKKCETIP